MKKFTTYIPNTITCGNLFCGCIATYAGFSGEYAGGVTFILLAGLFDFFDGFAARFLHAYSPIGKELDSLADIISFGMAPAAMVYSVLSDSLPAEWYFLSYSAFLITLFSALRLAKFNIDDRQRSTFIGLPVPANAIFWASFVFTSSSLFAVIYWEIFLLLIVLFCFLLVSNLPMFSLKMKNYSWAENRQRYSFLILSVLLVGLSGFNYDAFYGSFSIVICLYILFSLYNYIVARR